MQKSDYLMIQGLRDYHQIVWESPSWIRHSLVSFYIWLKQAENYLCNAKHHMDGVFILIFVHMPHHMQNPGKNLKKWFSARVSSHASSSFSFAERRSSIFDSDYFRIRSWEARTMMVVINWHIQLVFFLLSNGHFSAPGLNLYFSLYYQLFQLSAMSGASVTSSPVSFTKN